jgi:hypothetical protein
MRLAGPLGIAIFFVYLVAPTLLFISLSRVVAELGRPAVLVAVPIAFVFSLLL